MDGIIINELSLNGQFNDGRDFWTTAMPPFHKALQDALSLDVKLLFKRSSFYGALATPDRTIHSLLIDRETRTIDEARRYKSALARAINDPFWDEDPQQDYNSVYIPTVTMFRVVRWPKRPTDPLACCHLSDPDMRNTLL